MRIASTIIKLNLFCSTTTKRARYRHTRCTLINLHNYRYIKTLPAFSPSFAARLAIEIDRLKLLAQRDDGCGKMEEYTREREKECRERDQQTINSD